MTSYIEYITNRIFNNSLKHYNTIIIALLLTFVLTSDETSFTGTRLAQFVKKPVRVQFLLVHPLYC